jgi:hypothetical protein
MIDAAVPFSPPSRRAVLNLIGGAALLAEAPAAARQALAAKSTRFPRRLLEQQI